MDGVFLLPNIVIIQDSKDYWDLPSKPSDEAPFGFPPRPSGILLLLSLSEAFLSDLSFLSFDPKIDSLEDLVGVSVFPTEFTDVSFSTLPFSLSFKWLPPSVVSLPPPTPSLGGASSSRDFKESPAERKKINTFRNVLYRFVRRWAAILAILYFEINMSIHFDLKHSSLVFVYNVFLRFVKAANL